MASIASLSVRISAEISAYSNALNSAVKQANKAAGEIERQFKGLASLGKTFSSVGMEMTKAFTLPIVALAGFAVSARSDMQKLEMGLDAITGSSTETAKQLARLKEIAKLPGLSLEDATKATINLQSVGVEATRAERFVKGFGNALALVGKGASDLNPVITQLVQMSTKSKVVAGDLRPIMDAVPQVAGIIKNFYGTIDTEALQKMSVGTKEFTEVVLAGLERLPKAGAGIGNSFENLKDSVRNSFAEIGKSLEGPTTFILDRLSKVVDGIQDLTVKFQTLPAPAQSAIGAFVALAAVLGPLMIGFGQLAKIGPAIVVSLTRLGAVFGVGASAVVGWAVAIAAAVAALAALGTWVYQNWEPIVAVLTTAWSGPSDLWGAVWSEITRQLEAQWNLLKTIVGFTWGPVIKFFITMWDQIAPGMKFVWESISSLLSGIWTSISALATDIWDGIKSRFNAFIEWAKKTVPGAAKLLSLGDVWADEQKKLAAKATVAAPIMKTTPSGAKFAGGGGDDKVLKDALSMFGVSQQASLKEMQKALALVKAQFDAGKISAADYVKALEKMAEATWLAEHPTLALQIASLKLGAAAEKELQPLRDAEAGLKNKSIAQIAVNQSMAQSAPIFDIIRQKLLDTADAASRSALALNAMNMVKAGVEALLKPYTDLSDRIKELGVVTSAEATARYENAQKALDDALATNEQLGVEFYTRKDILKLQYEALKAKEASIGLTKQEQEQLISLNSTLETSNRSVLDQFKRKRDLAQEVSTVLTNMSQRIADNIIHWKSMKDVALSTLQEIGKAILGTVIQNLMESTGLIDKLSKGLSGVLSKIPKLGGLFGGGSKATTAAAGAAGDVASSVKSVTSTASKAISSTLSSVTGMVTGAISAVSGIIGNFQMAGMNKTLDLLENYLRYIKIWTGEQSQNLLWCGQKTVEYLGYVNASLDHMKTMMSGGLQFSPVAAGAISGGGDVNITITGGTYVGGIETIVDAMIREMRLRGLLKT